MTEALKIHRLKSRLIRISSYSLVVGLVMAMTLTGAGYWLLSTTAGSRWLVDKLLGTATPDLRYEQLSGTLETGLSLTGIRLPFPATGEGSAGELTIARLDGIWSLWNLLGGQLPIEKLHAEGVEITPPSSDAEAQPAAPSPWPSLSMPLPVNLQDVQITNLQIHSGDSDIRIDRIHLSALLGPFQTWLKDLAIEMGDNHLALHGKVGNRAPYPGELSFSWRYRLQEQSLAGTGSLTGSLARLQLQHQLDTPFSATTRGTVTTVFTPDTMALDLNQGTLDLENHWQGAEIPVPQRAPLTASGSLIVAGNAQALHYQLSAQAQESPAGDDEPPPSAMSVTSEGELQHQADSGITWQASLAVENLPPAMVDSRLAGSINSAITTSGQWHGEDFDISAVIQSLNGQLITELGQHPVTGRGELHLTPQQTEFRQLQLAVGDNHIEADGAVGKTLDANWRLSAPQLNVLSPALQGSLSGTGTLSGTLAQPQIQADLTGRGLAYDQWQLNSLSANLAQGGEQLNMTLNGQGLDAPWTKKGNLSVTAAGSLADHQLHFSFDAKDSALTLSASGGFLQGLWQNSWQGRISTLTITHPATGPWQLDSPATLTAGKRQIDLNQLCLRQQAASLCAHFQQAGNDSEATLEVKSLGLETLSPWLPVETTLAGVAHGQLRVKRLDEQLQGTVALNVENGELHLQRPDKTRAEVFPFYLAGNAELQTNQLISQIQLSLQDAGEFHADLAITNPWGQGDIRGDVAGDFTTLTWLDGFFPALEALDGTARVAFTLGGNLANPSLQGRVDLDSMHLQIPQAGLSLQQGKGHIQLQDTDWQLSASIRSGPGQLSLSGQGQLDGRWQPTGEIQLEGEQFTLVDLADMYVEVQPAVHLALEAEKMALTGELEVTKGNLKLRPLPESGISVSADESIYPSEKPTAEPRRPMATDITLRIAKGFGFEGYGLTSKLSGSLRLNQTTGQSARGFGKIRISDGQYLAYGQKLSIDKGVLIFQGPLDNPGLNIRAVRETRYATVGLNIGGTARDISSQLFSNPALPDTDALSVLVTGKPLSEASEADANQIANAATAMGIARSGWITSRIQSTFGLDTVKLQSGESYEESALVVGKYLTPDLFISYVQDLFTPEGSVQLDYSLTEYLGLKATSGEKQSIDVLYKIEH